MSTTTNQITAMGAFAFSYDANGNLTQDDLYKYKYDAENRMVELRLVNDALVGTYAFDGKSLRVVKVVGADRTFYLYAGGQVISEFEDAASNTYAPGTLPGQAASDAGALLLYQHSDHLDTRLTTDQQGNATNQQAHYPYGEDWYLHDTTTSYMFTSYPHEAESGNDYAIHRSHSCRLGRFTTADPVRGRIRNPQRLNRYAYVMGDPTNRRDPRGLDTRSEDPEGDYFLELIDNAGAGGGTSEGPGGYAGPPTGFGQVGGWVGAAEAWHQQQSGGGLFGGGLFGPGQNQNPWEYCRQTVFVPCMNDAESAKRGCMIRAAQATWLLGGLTFVGGLIDPWAAVPLGIDSVASAYSMRENCEQQYSRDTEGCYARLRHCVQNASP